MVLIVGKKDLTRIWALSTSINLTEIKTEENTNFLIKNRTLVLGFKWVLVFMFFLSL